MMTRERVRAAMAVGALACCALTVAALASGCSSAPSGTDAGMASQTVSAAQALSGSQGLKLTASLATTDVVLPRSFAGTPWAAVQDSLALTGYDLTTYEGQQVTLNTYGMEAADGSRSSGYVVTVTYQDMVVAYYTLQPGASPSVGGLP